MNSLFSFLVPYLTIPILQSPCLSCSAVLIPREDPVLEEGPVHNGCGDEHNTSNSKVSLMFTLTASSKEVNTFQAHALKLDIHASIYELLLA